MSCIPAWIPRVSGEGLEVRVHIEPPAAQDAIRVFWKTDGRWQEVHSCGPDFTLPIESSVPGMEFGVEGRKRVSRSWDGYVQLELDLVNGAGETLLTHEYTLRVAPLILSNNLWKIQELFVVDTGEDNEPFRSVLKSVLARTSVDLVEIPGQEYMSESDGDTLLDAWVQDACQTGFRSWPVDGGPRSVFSALILPRQSGVERWFRDHRLGSDFEVLGPLSRPTRSQWNDSDFEESANYGGNLEVIPPHTAPGGARYPWGRILLGGGSTTDQMGIPRTVRWDQEYLDFLTAHDIQGPPLEVSTEWLEVRHVDEHTTFVPAPGTKRGWAIAIASPRLARSILEGVQREGGGEQKVFEGRWTEIEEDFLVWETTVNGILQNRKLMKFNDQVQARMDEIRDFYRDEIGVAIQEIIELPVLFEPLDNGLAIALSPNVVNMGVIPIEDGTTHLIVPDPEGPRFPVTDGWAEETKARLEALGTESQPVVVTFADVFWVYHSEYEGAHCGINTLRLPPRWDWWND